MIREIVKIDEALCDGCGNCIPNCHEGALAVIDGKARLVSDLLCDGLGACLGHCPQNAITIEKRETQPYDEIETLKLMLPKGKNTVVAHLKHLKDHNENEYLKKAMEYLQSHKNRLSFDLMEVIRELHRPTIGFIKDEPSAGCPGSRSQIINRAQAPSNSQTEEQSTSELRQWPVQLHLINPSAAFFNNSDLVLAADCVPFSMGNFHRKLLRGKTLAIACPKLDNGKEVYVKKLEVLINNAQVNTITVVMMEVPCCGGLLQMVRQAALNADRKVPIKQVVVSIEGNILKEEWV
ncbi:ATP-binding protein [Thermophagus sp. OGC60D27]|uniref:ATP-binding protein n=1 Tax=Thermophagus sp. OGC60D27 TaxID=3458415 RepID=UPI004037BE8B